MGAAGRATPGFAVSARKILANSPQSRQSWMSELEQHARVAQRVGFDPGEVEELGHAVVM
jgi:hypothetical protein